MRKEPHPPQNAVALTAPQKQNSRYTALDDFVFCKSDGSHLSPDVLRRDVLYPALGRLGIPALRAQRASTRFGTRRRLSSTSGLET